MIYLIAEKPTPVFNTSDLQALFGGQTGSLLLDDHSLLRACECILFPETVFEVVANHSDQILEVATKGYPSGFPLYIDRRFGTLVDKRPEQKKKFLPAPDKILSHIAQSLGLPYIWGGNISEGVSQLLEYYPPPSIQTLSKLERATWELKGLDCSGLLYEATGGVTPRNSAELLFYGKGVSIQGKQAKEILPLLKPLDLVVYRGHLFIVFNAHESIESKLEFGGVRKSLTLDRLKGFMEEEGKIPCDDPQMAFENSRYFLVRRFFS